MNEELQLIIQQQSGRIDKVLSDSFSMYTRSQFQSWLKENHVSVNGQVVKANYKVKEADRITVLIPEEEPLRVEPENISLDIVYEDEVVLVVHKPSGMVVHPSKGHASGTLVNALLYHASGIASIGEEFRPGIVHRIDKDTSGLLVVAKTHEALIDLAEQFSNKTSERMYVAIVDGVLPHEKGTIDAPLARSPHHRLKREVQKEGKPAVTHFEVLQRLKDKTVLALRLETGRTHQIRAHLEYIGFPIVNDPMYHPNGRVATSFGQYLHAQSLGFTHPTTKEWTYFEVSPPEEFMKIIRRDENKGNK